MLPLFKSNYSISKSILTLEDESETDGPDSIFQICNENEIDDLYLVEDSMSGFLSAYEGAARNKLNLRFGLRISCVDDLASDSKNFHRIVLFAKNSEGCHKLIKIFSDAATKFGKAFPTVDYKYLKQEWSKDLHLIIPYYDSYLYKNLLTLNTFVPDFTFTEPTYLKESNGLPFEGVLDRALEKAGVEVLAAKSIYYKDRADFEAWQTYKLITNRKAYGNVSLMKPEMEHCHSNEFCFESWNELR